MSQAYVEKEPRPEASQKQVAGGFLPGTKSVRQKEMEHDDLVHGQPVIITMRWILVASGLLLILWNASSVGETRFQVLAVLALAAFNFYLHAQLLMKRPVISGIVYGASLMDLAIITLMILSGSGFNSVTFVFYFPAIVAFAVVFPGFWTFVYTAGLISVYGLLAVMSSGDVLVILSRLVMIIAVAFCANLYLRIESTRRQAAQQAQDELMAQIQQRRAAATRQ